MRFLSRFTGWVRRLLGGRAPRPGAPPLNRPEPGPSFHLHLPGTMRARCGARMGPSVILTVETKMVTCRACQLEADAERLRVATSVR